MDPLALAMGNGLTITEVVGYPHAGNDVFACVGTNNGHPAEFYVKVARHRDADLPNEVAALAEVRRYGLTVPDVLAHGQSGGVYFAVLSAMPGDRLSTCLTGEKADFYRGHLPGFLQTMGRSLARIHTLPIRWRPVAERRQHLLPVLAEGNPLGTVIAETAAWLRENGPSVTSPVFIHGDHHYANILWKNGAISAVLDWELCGMGWREFDLAWAVVLRPSQTFLTSELDVDAFLHGYRQLADYDHRGFQWCRALLYTHFLNIQATWDDQRYQTVALAAIDEVRG